MSQRASSKRLFHGSSYRRAVQHANKRVLVPNEVRCGEQVVRLLGDEHTARSCGLKVVEQATPDGPRGRIEVPPGAATIPGRSEGPTDGRLYDAVRQVADAAAQDLSPPPPVLGHMVDPKREITMANFLVRIVQALLYIVLGQHAERILTPTALAYRPMNGVGAGLYAVQALMHRGFRWAARADIRAFFPSISTSHVLGAVSTAFPVEDGLLRMLSWSLRAPIVRRASHPAVVAGTVGLTSGPLKALYQGATISPVLSNIVGHMVFDGPFIEIMGPHAVLLRYSDDLLILARDPQGASDAMSAVRSLGERGGFEFHSDPTKTSPEPVDLGSDSLNFLGYEIGHGGVRLGTATFAKMVADLATKDPEEQINFGSFVDAALRLHLDNPRRLPQLLAATAQISEEHYVRMGVAMLHVRSRHRSRWIAEFQSFTDPLLRRVG